MKPFYRNILFVSLGALLVLLLVALVVFSRQSQNEALCKGVKITIEPDSAGLLTVTDVQEYFKLHVSPCTAKPINEINLSEVEQQLVSMPLIASAVCYIDSKDLLRIEIVEMVPVMHVLGGNHDYCIDKNGNQIPTPTKLRKDVALVDGRNVSLQFATGDLFALITYIRENGWSSEFSRFYVGAGNKVTMKSNLYGYDVTLGVPNEYVRKFDKLTRFRQAVPDHGQYHSINLDYYGQIICK